MQNSAIQKCNVAESLFEWVKNVSLNLKTIHPIALEIFLTCIAIDKCELVVWLKVLYLSSLAANMI